MRCGSCAPCQERSRHELEDWARQDSESAWPAPTTKGLERHATRFGPDQVGETASQFGLTVTLARVVTRRTPRGPSLRARVAALVAQGHGVDVVALMEDLSPSQARRLVEEVSG